LQVSEDISQEEHMLEMLRSEKEDLESEVCRFRVMKAKLLQQIAYVGILYHFIALFICRFLCRIFLGSTGHFPLVL